MDEILKDLSPTSLTNAIEANMISWVPLFAHALQGEAVDTAELKRSITGYSIPLFNSIMGAQLPPERVEPVIQSIITDASARSIPVLWWTGPSTHPADLGTFLLKHGFVLVDDETGMAVDLAYLDENRPLPPNLSIQRVQDGPALKQWCRTMVAGFEIPPLMAEIVAKSWYDLLSRIDTDSVQAYLAWWGDMPVAISLLHQGGGVAGIYAVATVPEARRRGIGAWITLRPLLQARLKGYRVGILQASEMGLSVYRSLGFQEYCQIRSYRWRPETKG